MCSNCGKLSDARILFDEIPFRNIVAWTSLITGNAQNDDAHEALMVFKEFLMKRVKEMVRRLELLVDSASMSPLLDAYIKCGEMNFTGKVFDEMAEKNVVSWNSMKTPSSSNHPVAAEEVDADGESSSTIANCVDRVRSGLLDNEIWGKENKKGTSFYFYGKIAFSSQRSIAFIFPNWQHNDAVEQLIVDRC
ncbi:PENTATRICOPEPTIDE REPEAT-CONTAINING PROTEIN [Salix purpurea]|uniref:PENTATRICOPEPTIDE REPEAT-CONTAINING PROTEIN n=1 Tax=Salix purpurea TaxID=77065 RepID=A0A9Q0VTX2_SALPP|nr:PENTATRICOPEPTIDE REPEAT-CONTAINING PROTEIN [Salix purpurea]